jgi:hypothetical protein
MGVGGIATSNDAERVYIDGSGLGGITTLTNDASVAAGTIVGSGSTLGIGTQAAESGAYQMFTSQVSTNGSYNMTTADIGKLFSYDVTSSPTFSLTNASMFAAGQAIGFVVDAGSTNTLTKSLTIVPASGDQINSQTNWVMSALHNSTILVSDGANKWHPVANKNVTYFESFDDTDISLATADTYYILTIDDAGIVDPLDMHSPSVNPTRVYATQSGVYIVNVRVNFLTANNNAKHNAYVFRNGSLASLVGWTQYAVGTDDVVGSSLVYMEKGDYIEINVLFTGGDAGTEAVRYFSVKMSLLY